MRRAIISVLLAAGCSSSPRQPDHADSAAPVLDGATDVDPRCSLADYDAGLLAIAALGGHLKHNWDPGWMTLSRGYEKLRTLTEGWAARHQVAWTDV